MWWVSMLSLVAFCFILGCFVVLFVPKVMRGRSTWYIGIRARYSVFPLIHCFFLDKRTTYTQAYL